jgi:hypothetical protein
MVHVPPAGEQQMPLVHATPLQQLDESEHGLPGGAQQVPAVHAMPPQQSQSCAHWPPGARHAVHAPELQKPEQQSPSSLHEVPEQQVPWSPQSALQHCEGLVHSAPLEAHEDGGTHWPALQTSLPMQSALDEHGEPASVPSRVQSVYALTQSAPASGSRPSMHVVQLA